VSAGGADETAEARVEATASREPPPPVRPLREASRSFLVGLGLIGLVGLGVRVYFVLVGYASYKIGGDAIFYHLQGWVIADGHWFIDPGRFYFSHGRIITPSAAHPPLYGMYLGLVSRLGFWSVTAHRLASCLLGTGAVVLIGLAGRKMASERVGLIASLLAALYANLWINDGMLLSESMTALTAVLVLLAAYALWRRATLANAAWFGLALGLATLSRAEIVLVAPLVTLPLVLGMRYFTLRRRMQMLGVIALCMVALVGPWVGYNMTRFAKPVTLTDSFGAVLSSASCDRTYYGHYAGWYWACYTFPHGDVPGDASQRDAVVQRDAIRYIRHHLHRLPVVMAMRVGRLWDVYRPGQTLYLNAVLEGRTHAASRLAVISYWLMMPLAIAGVIVLRRWRIPTMPILGPTIGVTIAAAIFFGVLRYRVSAEPSIVLAAAVSIDVLWTSLVDRRRATVRSGQHESASDPVPASVPATNT
jgi:4-amino-4-deoxy-L-arabinose transferase-like glycosyltransferase